MPSLVGYELADSVATLTMDDGKVNALSPQMLTEINLGLDRAGADGAAVVVLAGRDGVFSAGFDLPLLRGGGEAAAGMLRAGFELAARLLSYPRPVVIACTGHAVAMGAFLLLSADYRIGARRPCKITANEVAIGITLPRAAIEICRQRLAPAHFSRVTVLAEQFDADGAMQAGFLDQCVPPDELWDTVRTVADALARLDLDAHQATKDRARAAALGDLRDAIAADSAELAEGQLRAAADPAATA
jgi:enoyl-CoA hydratase